MSFGEYSFLPWLRRGIANQLQVPAGAASRASLTVGLQVASNTAAPVDVPPRTVLLSGPGDVVGVNPQMVLRTEPRLGVTNFEPNYLAYVDFYDEDFTWRYTPDLPDVAKHRLPPWLTLTVLTDAEFQRVRRTGQPLPAVQLTPAADPSAIFPPAAQIWAWAHVHLNVTLGATAGAPNLDVLGTMLRTNPDVGYSRLLSPRHLQPNTRYHAFVIPTFEVGRQAGLGETVAEGSSGLALSWATARVFPVYFEWWFATGAAGDFEDLVRALVPRDVDPRVGIRSMDVQQPGFLLPPTSGQPDDLVGLEGVLLAPTTKHVPVAPTCDLPANLATQVNLPADQQDGGAAAGEDPLISAPLYGRWHALVERVQPFPAQVGWVNELNTDPRFRAVAGMGTKVIQRNQEDYMKLAWQQVGDVLSMNRKIQSVQLAVKANDALLAKSFVVLPPEQALAMAGPVMRKVMGSPVTVHALVRASRLPRAALSGAMRAHLRPRGMLMRRALGPARVARPLAETVARLNDGRITAAPPPPAPDGATYGSTLVAVAPQVPAWLACLARHARLALAVLFGVVVAAVVVLALLGAALAFVLPLAAIVVLVALYLYRRLDKVGRQLETVDAFQPGAMTPAAFAALPPNDAFVLPVGGAPGPQPAPAGGPDSPQGAAFRTAVIEFAGGFADRPGAPALRDPLTVARAWSSVASAMVPARAFTTRFAATLRVGTSGFAEYIGGYFDTGTGPAPVDPRIVPVMAYPDIKLAMYAPLRDVLKDDFVPNLQLVPPNTLSLMLTNPPVIESYMVGLNHEFARELLWREYPTDQRPSTFRQFWDPTPFVDTDNLSALQLAEKVRDIRKIHEWLPDTSLGTHDNRPTPGNQPRVVLIIRGDLLKRYPNAIIYAQRARWGDPPRHTNHLLLHDQTGEGIHLNPKDPAFSFPIFRAQVDPDITFIGFDLTLDEVRGDPTLDESQASRLRVDPTKLGWFFVLQEVVGEPRFGMDEHAVKTQGSDPMKWDYLSWENLGANVSVIDLKPLATEPPGSDDQGAKWGAHAADMALILFQRPALVAVHGREMLKNLALP